MDYEQTKCCGSGCASCPKKGDAAACPREQEGDSPSQGCGGCCSSGCGGCHDRPRGNLFGTNWLSGVSDASNYDIVEVEFKNTRKGFYRNPDRVDLHMGDMVAVEATPGHDIGQIVMVGRLVDLHMRKAGIKNPDELKKVFRLARPQDLEKYEEARAREQDTMIRSRKIAEELGLNMKIGDVEYQGDGAKAIFYYIADERVDFRKLIRVLAETFKIRIEMKQIGARQEAGRIGGIGPCGRPLCCASWMTDFVSVGTSAARVQDLSMNPQKLAGQCAKLKCCLNFEADTYIEASRALPNPDIPLETLDATYYHFKTDTLAGLMSYSTEKRSPANLVTLPASRVREIIEINKRGEKVEALLPDAEAKQPPKEFVELVGQEDISRFDKATRKKKKRSPQRDQARAGKKEDAKPRQERRQPSEKKAEGRKGDSADRPRDSRGNQRRRRPEKKSADSGGKKL